MRINNFDLLSIGYAKRGSRAHASLIASRRVVTALSIMTTGEV
jgi:hypothetical protein